MEEFYINDLKQVTATTFAKSKKLQIIGCVLLDVEPTDLVEWFPWIKYVIFNWKITTRTQTPPTGYVRDVKNTKFIAEHTFDMSLITVDQVKMLGSLWSPYTYQREGLTKLTYMLHEKHFNEPVFKYLVNELKFDINEK